MFISNILSVAWAASLFFGSSSALAVKRDGTQTASKLSLTFSSYSGYATPTNIPHVTRDGGGGGWLNGHFVIAFSDTTTSNSDGDMLPGGFVSNSAAYIPNTEDPLALEGFATDGVADLLVPWDESECVAGEDCNWDIWPESTSYLHSCQDLQDQLF